MTTKFFQSISFTRMLTWAILLVTLMLTLVACQTNKSDQGVSDTVMISDSSVQGKERVIGGEPKAETTASDYFHWPTWMVSLSRKIKNASAPIPSPEQVSLKRVEKFSSDNAIEYGLSYGELDEGSFFVFDACGSAYDEHLVIGVQTTGDSVIATIGLMNKADSRVYRIQEVTEMIDNHLLLDDIQVRDLFSGKGPYIFRLSEVSTETDADNPKNRITVFQLEDVTPDGFEEMFSPMFFVVSSDLDEELPYPVVSYPCEEFSDN